MELIIGAAVLALGFLFGAVFRPYLTGYSAKKGENLATHEDIDKLVEQMTAVTQATKQIEAKISDEVWNRQRHWEMKREAIVGIIQALLEAGDALQSLARALRLETDAEGPVTFAETVSERCRKCVSIIDAVNSKRVLALMVCDRDLDQALSDMYETLRVAAGKLGDRDVKGYEELSPALRKKFAKALFFARRELGMDWKSANPQSAESSTAPNRVEQDPGAGKPAHRG
jgi:predicted oxidoreductase